MVNQMIRLISKDPVFRAFAKRFLICGVLAIAGLAPAVWADEFSELRLEGLIYDQNDPAQTMVVLNGEFLRKGESYRHFLILEVAADAVRIKNTQTGNETSLQVIGASEHQQKLLSEQRAAASGTSAKPEGWWQQAMARFQKWRKR